MPGLSACGVPPRKGQLWDSSASGGQDAAGSCAFNVTGSVSCPAQGNMAGSLGVTLRNSRCPEPCSLFLGCTLQTLDLQSQFFRYVPSPWVCWSSSHHPALPPSSSMTSAGGWFSTSQGACLQSRLVCGAHWKALTWTPALGRCAAATRSWNKKDYHRPKLGLVCHLLPGVVR